MLVPASVVGAIIGKGGQTVRQITQLKVHSYSLSLTLVGNLDLNRILEHVSMFTSGKDTDRIKLRLFTELQKHVESQQTEFWT